MGEPTTQTFRATLERPEGIGTWTFLPIPVDLKQLYGGVGQIKVRGTIDGEPFRSSALPRGDGTHYLVVGGAIRDRIGATTGSTVTVVLEPDLEERTVDVPPELERAFSSDQPARSSFDSFSYSHRKEYVEWIATAKTDATRQKRIATALEMIKTGLSPRRPKKA